MPLSEYEQRMLDELENSLKSEDPDLAKGFAEPTARPSLRRYLVGVIGSLAGVGVLISGVALSLPLLGVAGFIILFAAVASLVMAPSGGESAAQEGGPSRPSATAAPAKKPLRERMEDRWDRRQRGEN